ncbi:unnamed protein product, partial [Symbiodinium sp. KB8]
IKWIDDIRDLSLLGVAQLRDTQCWDDSDDLSLLIAFRERILPELRKYYSNWSVFEMMQSFSVGTGDVVSYFTQTLRNTMRFLEKVFCTYELRLKNLQGKAEDQKHLVDRNVLEFCEYAGLFNSSFPQNFRSKFFDPEQLKQLEAEVNKSSASPPSTFRKVRNHPEEMADVEKDHVKAMQREYFPSQFGLKEHQDEFLEMLRHYVVLLRHCYVLLDLILLLTSIQGFARLGGTNLLTDLVSKAHGQSVMSFAKDEVSEVKQNLVQIADIAQGGWSNFRRQRRDSAWSNKSPLDNVRMSINLMDTVERTHDNAVHKIGVLRRGLQDALGKRRLLKLVVVATHRENSRRRCSILGSGIFWSRSITCPPTMSCSSEARSESGLDDLHLLLRGAKASEKVSHRSSLLLVADTSSGRGEVTVPVMAVPETRPVEACLGASTGGVSDASSGALRNKEGLREAGSTSRRRQFHVSTASAQRLLSQLQSPGIDCTAGPSMPWLLFRWPLARRFCYGGRGRLAEVKNCCGLGGRGAMEKLNQEYLAARFAAVSLHLALTVNVLQARPDHILAALSGSCVQQALRMPAACRQGNCVILDELSAGCRDSWQASESIFYRELSASIAFLVVELVSMLTAVHCSQQEALNFFGAMLHLGGSLVLVLFLVMQASYAYFHAVFAVCYVLPFLGELNTWLAIVRGAYVKRFPPPETSLVARGLSGGTITTEVGLHGYRTFSTRDTDTEKELMEVLMNLGRRLRFAMLPVFVLELRKRKTRSDRLAGVLSSDPVQRKVRLRLAALYPHWSFCVTALARPLRTLETPLLQTLLMPEPATSMGFGLLTLDQGRCLLCLLEDEALAQEVPLVGVWVDQRHEMHKDPQSPECSPAAWAAAAHFVKRRQAREKVWVEKDTFLVMSVVQTRATPASSRSTQLLFSEFRFEDVPGEEGLHLASVDFDEDQAGRSAELMFLDTFTARKRGDDAAKSFLSDSEGAKCDRIHAHVSNVKLPHDDVRLWRQVYFGDGVEYFSRTREQWIPALIKSDVKHSENGLCLDLNSRSAVPLREIRLKDEHRLNPRLLQDLHPGDAVEVFDVEQSQWLCARTFCSRQRAITST